MSENTLPLTQRCVPSVAVRPSGTFTRPSVAPLGTLVGPYELLTRIGDGGAGIVYRAVHHDLGRHVAIKFARHDDADDPHSSARELRDEARLLAAVTHEYVIRIYDFARDPYFGPFIVMELVAGPSLEALLSTAAPFDEVRTRLLGAQLASALAAVHAAGLVHADVKPANVVVEPRVHGSEVAKLIDFGLGKSVADQDETLPGVFGTPRYMSPEQWRGERLDVATDVYSFGLILYRMVTGRVPFAGTTLEDRATGKTQDVGPAPRTLQPALSLELCRLIESCVAPRPEHRWLDMAEISRVLSG